MDVYQRRRLVALSALAGIFILFVLLIRSCGGDDESTEPLAAGASGASGAATVTVLAQVDYIAQGDPICLQANTSLEGIDESDPVEADSSKASVVSGELQQLQSLPPPDAGTSDLDKFLSSLEKQALAYQDRSTASERGDDATVADLTSTLEKAQGQAEDSGKAFGFKVCGDLSKVGEATSTGGGGGGGTETDTGGTVTPTEPATPTTTTPVPVAPPDTDSGTVTPTPTPTPPADGGTDGGSSGGVSP